MPINSPFVSIGVPVFNDKPFLRKALDALLSQTYSNIEIILSDDCSSDGSAEICQEYVSKDTRVKYIRQQKNLGISRNMEFLLSFAKGKYFMWAADDDLWDKDFVKILVGLLEEHPECVAAFGPWICIDEEGKRIDAKERNVNYGSKSTLKRLFKLCYYWDDGFGYGLFRREKILHVEFPVWWWINKKRAYNNIYPTLLFYLTCGNFIQSEGRILWYNTVKKECNINHKVPYNGKFVRGYAAFCLWKFNVYYECMSSICKAKTSGIVYAACLVPVFGARFIKDLVLGFYNYGKSFIRGERSFF